VQRQKLIRASVLILAALLGWVTAVTLARADSSGFVKLLSDQGSDGEFPGWRSFHDAPDAKSGDVWTLKADGVLHCKGKPLGYLISEKDYTNFVLKLEWRWPQGAEPGRGGVLLRTTGPNRIWPKSLEAQINTGGAGDFWGLDGYRLEGPAERTKTLEHPQFGKLINVEKLANLERPAGEWNRYEIHAEGETVTLTINGREVNRATGCDVVAGGIAITAEGDPIEFRNVQLQPLD
jgi:hypothetical protein